MTIGKTIRNIALYTGLAALTAGIYGCATLPNQVRNMPSSPGYVELNTSRGEYIMRQESYDVLLDLAQVYLHDNPKKAKDLDDAVSIMAAMADRGSNGVIKYDEIEDLTKRMLKKVEHSAANKQADSATVIAKK